MFSHKSFISVLAFLGLLLGTTSQTYALDLSTPIIPLSPIIFGPNVTMTSPTTDERIVQGLIVDAEGIVPRITIMFDQKIQASGSASSTIKLTNITDTVTVTPTAVNIADNGIYITTGGLQIGKEYEVKVFANQVKRADTGTVMNGDYIWHFTIVSNTLSFPPLLESEPRARLLITKTAITPTVNILGSANTTADYSIRISNTGTYSFNSVTIFDALPKGFSFNSIISGDVTSVIGDAPLRITIPGIAPGAERNVDFRVNIDGGSNSLGQLVPAGNYNNLAIAKATFTPEGSGVGAYTQPVSTGASRSNTSSSDNITITRSGFIPPTFVFTGLPTFTFSPTPTVTTSPSPTITTSPTPTPTVVPSGSLPHPSSDPLTCLRLNGATALNFSDVSASATEAPYVSFLNTTVFNSDRDVRLSRGYSDGTFGMNNTLTRFELTKMALGANCVNYISSPTRNSFFTDVPTDDSEISLVIGKARALGIVQGVGNQFYPNRPVSYGEMVKILVGSGTYFDHGTAHTPLAHMLTGITDESFRQFAEHAARMNLVNLGTANYFPQNDFVLRRSMAQAVARYIAWLKNISLV